MGLIVRTHSPIPNFWYTFIPIIANPDSHTDGSSRITLGEKTEKWPFFVLYVAFDKNFLLWIKGHI